MHLETFQSGTVVQECAEWSVQLYNPCPPARVNLRWRGGHEACFCAAAGATHPPTPSQSIPFHPSPDRASAEIELPLRCAAAGNGYRWIASRRARISSELQENLSPSFPCPSPRVRKVTRGEGPSELRHLQFNPHSDLGKVVWNTLLGLAWLESCTPPREIQE